MFKVCKVCNLEKEIKEFDSRKFTCNSCRAFLQKEKNRKLRDEKTKELKSEIAEIKHQLDNNLKQIRESDDEFLDFIKTHKRSNFLTQSWFWDIWIPLSRKEYVLVSEDILTWMGFSSVKKSKVAAQSSSPVSELLCAATFEELEKYSYHQKYDFIRFLNKNNLRYEEIKYDNSLIQKYPKIQYDINMLKLLVPSKLPDRTWIIMEVNIFKKSLMMLNTKPANLVKEYYIDLEQIFMDYLFYKSNKKDEEIKTKEEKLKTKDEEIKTKEEKLKEAEMKTLTLKEKIISLEKLKENQLFYISSSNSYAAQNRFKVGGLKDIDQVKSRLSTYNGRSAEGDEWGFDKIYKVCDYKLFEEKFWGIFESFRDKSCSKKEMIVMRYDDLVYAVEFMIENYHKEIIYFNTNLERMKENAEDLTNAIIPDHIQCIEFVEKFKIDHGIVTKRFLRNFRCDFIITRGFNKGKKCKNMTGFTDKLGNHFCYRHK